MSRNTSLKKRPESLSYSHSFSGILEYFFQNHGFFQNHSAAHVNQSTHMRDKTPAAANRERKNSAARLSGTAPMAKPTTIVPLHADLTDVEQLVRNYDSYD